jgi:hypothetical protein
VLAVQAPKFHAIQLENREVAAYWVQLIGCV